MEITNEKYGKCSECGQFAVHLAMSGYVHFYGDQDDDEGDESIYHDVEPPEPDEEIYLFAHICFSCGHVEDVGIEGPRDKAIDTATRPNNVFYRIRAAGLIGQVAAWVGCKLLVMSGNIDD